MAELTRLKRLRAGHRSSTKRIINQTRDNLRAEETSLTKLRQQETTLREKLTTLKELNDGILEKVADDEIEVEIEQIDSYNEDIQLVLFEIEEALKIKLDSPGEGTPTRLTSPAASSSSPSVEDDHPPSVDDTRPPLLTEHGSRTSSVESSSVSRTVRVKLPKIELQKFDGNPLKWMSFWDTFESTVHNNPDLTEVDKFNYLHSLLDYSAAEAISGLSLTASNYTEALAILRRRYGDHQLIISKHMETLLNIDPVPSYNTKSLRQLYDKVESHVRGLKALGVTAGSYGSLLASTLLNKLPQYIKLIVSRGMADSDWSLDGMMKRLVEEIEARERATATQICAQPTSSPSPIAFRRGRDVPSVRAMLASDVCSYCKQGHPSFTCTVVTDAESRKKILKKSGRCFNCLRRHHISKDCRSPTKCHRCNGRHHTSICTKTQNSRSTASVSSGSPDQESSLPKTANPIAPTSDSSSTTTMYTNVHTPILLQTARAFIVNPDAINHRQRVRVIFDGGSQRSYITDNMRRILDLSTEAVETILIKTFGSSDDQVKVCDVVRVGVETEDKTVQRLPMLSVPYICDPIGGQPLSCVLEGYPHLANLDLSDIPTETEDLKIDILIGADNYWKLVTGEVVRQEGCPTAVKTRLGWVLSGPLEIQPTHLAITKTPTHVLRVDATSIPLDSTLNRFWDLETLGIKNTETSLYEDFTRTITFRDGRYEVHLPWKETHPPLPSNYDLSLKRLSGLIRRLKHDPPLLKEYDAIIKEQRGLGIIEEVEGTERENDAETHYIPHHAVVRRDKETTKLRVVFDASAKSNGGTSLNECLYVGPPLSQKLLDIILRFRLSRIGLIGDVEKAFLMVSVSPGDRNALRFLWIDNIDAEAPQVITMRFKRVMFGVSSSPFLLNGTIKYHIEKYLEEDPEFVKRFLHSIYVDDVVFGAPDVPKAFELYSKAKERLSKGGFNLRRFFTNSAELKQYIENAEKKLMDGLPDQRKLKEEDESYAQSTLGDHQNLSGEEQKVLGIHWNFVRDTFMFDIHHIAKVATSSNLTKRGIVSISARFYDPLGVLSPCILLFKLLLKRVWEADIDWDERLPGQLLTDWKKLLTQLERAPSISIPRCYFGDSRVTTYCLRGFCDASVKAYGAVVYLKLDTMDGITTQFVASKTRVAPSSNQSITIPRLELLSALLLARLMSVVTEALSLEIELKSPICYSDSRVALAWITSNKEWKQFVRNRVLEIRKLVPAGNWRHCKGKDNPADLPSRGATPAELHENSIWLKGPPWLCTADNETQNLNDLDLQNEGLEELKKTQVMLVANEEKLVPFLECEKFSSLSRLLGVTGCVLKFIEQARGKETNKGLTAAIRRRALMYWIKLSQYSLLEERQFKIWMHQFDLFKDEDGVWRCGGRLKGANIPQSTKHPIILNPLHHLSTLIVQECHKLVRHGGVAETLAQVRSSYWIVKGRNFVRKLIHRCVTCRRAEGLPFKAPKPPALPESRISEAPPFTFTGVDFAGPLYLRDSDEKLWICLFTCGIVRAVHLEVVTDLSAQSFIRCFTRFVSRRGLPSVLISDNAKTFKSARQILQTILNDPEVKKYLLNHQISWEFNLERAPWWGGFFERLIGLMKRCLKKGIGQARMSLDELSTLVAEVEAILNSRPLTYVSTEDVLEPLTPSHLLIGRRLISLPKIGTQYAFDPNDEEFQPSQSSPPELNKRLNYLNSVLDQFWVRWRREYLVSLRETHRHCGRHADSHIKEGEVCVVFDQNCPRTLWRLARVQKLIYSKDEKVRGAVVKTVTKSGNISVLRRPVQHLYPLEVCDEAEALNTPTNDDTKETPNPAQEHGRPIRNAAQVAKERLKTLCEELREQC